MTRQTIQYYSTIRSDVAQCRHLLSLLSGCHRVSCCLPCMMDWNFGDKWTQINLSSLELFCSDIFLERKTVSTRERGHFHDYLNMWLRRSLCNWFVGGIWNILEDVDRESLEFCKQYLMDKHSMNSEAQSVVGNAKGETVHEASGGNKSLLRTGLRIVLVNIFSVS